MTHHRLHVTRAEMIELQALSDAVREARSSPALAQDEAARTEAMVARMRALWAEGGEGDGEPVFAGPGFTPIEILMDKEAR